VKIINIIVCVKPVPDPEKYNLLTIDPESKRLVREGIPMVVNPVDKNALEAALQIKEKQGGKVTVLSMAPIFSQDKIKECLAMGADEAYILSDRAFGGADTYATSYTLAKGLEKLDVAADLILAGNSSADGATSHVPSQLGERLNMPHISNVHLISVDDGVAKVRKKTEGGFIDYQVTLPAVLGIARGSNTPRLTSAIGVIRVKNKPITVYSKDDIDVDEALIGVEGSPTQAGELHTPDLSRRAEVLDGDHIKLAQQIIEILKRTSVMIKD